MDTIMHSNKMIEILKYIKHYNGSEKSELDDFIKSSEYTLGLVTTEPDKKAILDYIMNVALGGRAAYFIRIQQIDSFECLKKQLKQRFQKNPDTILFCDIQKSDETVNDYASRFETDLYIKIENALEKSPEESPVKSFLTKLTQSFFEACLYDDDIKQSVDRCNFKKFSDSVAGALREEENINANKEKNGENIICMKCKKLGHNANECRSKPNNKKHSMY